MYLTSAEMGLEAGYRDRVQMLKKGNDGAMSMSGDDVM